MSGMTGLITFVTYQWSFLALAVLLLLDTICAYRAGAYTALYIYDLSQDMFQDLEVAHERLNA